jgi:hypothetical protein
MPWHRAVRATGLCGVTKYKAEIYYPHPPDVVAVVPATGPTPALSLVVRTLKREVRAFRGCLGMHRR